MRERRLDLRDPSVGRIPEKESCEMRLPCVRFTLVVLIILDCSLAGLGFTPLVVLILLDARCLDYLGLFVKCSGVPRSLS